jgi:tetratricopeptide (TPR) repeat protein
MLCQLKKDYGKCETQMRASLRIYDELGDNTQKLKTMNNLAWLYSIIEDWDKSMDLLEDMIRLSSSIGDFLNKGFGLLNSADILLRQGQYEEAEKRLNRAYHHFVLLNEVRMIHSTEHTFAMLYKRKGSIEKARFFFDRTSEGYARNEIINQFPELLFEYGDMEDSEGSREKAEELYRRALKYANQMKDEMWIEKINGRLLTDR